MADDKKLEEKIGNINDNLNSTLDYITDIGKNLNTGLVSQFVKINENTRQLAEGLLTSKDLTKDLTKLNSELVKLNTKNTELGIEKSIAEQALQEASAKYNQNQNTANARLLITAKNNLKNLSLQIQITDKLRDQLASVKAVAEEEAKLTEEKKKQNSLSGNAKKLLTDMIKPMTELFTVAGFLKNMIDSANQFDKASVNISKNLGVSSASANGIAARMETMSLFSRSTTVNMKNLVEAQGQLNSALGLAYEYSDETLKTQIMLTKQFGLTGEEAAGIYQFSVLAGKSSEKVNDEMVGAFVASKNSLKVGANFKDVMAEAAKVSGQLAANFKNNPALITAAIVQAKALGTTLEQTRDQGKSLLDFESSISNELEAELMTGQQMNLERARAAALMGDQVTVAKELANQGMTYEKFQNMNVLAQESFAKALGLSGDKLAEQLKKQKMAQESGKSLAEITKQDALEAEKRQTIQDRFNDAVEKLKDIFGIIGVILTPIAQILSFMVDNTWTIYAGLLLWAATSKGIGGTFKGIVDSMKSMGTGIMDKIKGKGAEAAATSTADVGGKGGGMLSSLKGINTTDMIKGAAAILILSAALFVAAKAFQEFATVKWEDVVLGGIALVGLAIIAKSLGKSAPAIIEGAIAIGILGIALIPLAYALNLAAPAIEAFGNVILKVFTGIGIVIKAAADGISTIFTSLTNVDVSKLLAIGPALIMVGLGLASLGAGSVIGAIGAFLGGDPIAKIERLAASGDGLQKAATGLQGVATALTQVASALAGIDVSKLEALDKFASNRSSDSVVGGITSFLTAPIKAIGSMVEGAGGGNGNTEMVKAINEVRDSVNKLYAKDSSIHMDGKKVGTTLTQGSHKVA
jgi:hypothetical protein